MMYITYIHHAPVRASFDLQRPHKARTPTKSTTEPNSSTSRTSRTLQMPHERWKFWGSNMHRTCWTCTKPQSTLAKQERHAQSIRNAPKERHHNMSTSCSLSSLDKRWTCREIICVETVWIHVNTEYSLKCNVRTRKLQDDPEKFGQNVDGFHACNKRPKPIVSPWPASSPARTLKCGKHLQTAPEYFIVTSYIYYTICCILRKHACATSRTANRIQYKYNQRYM